MISQHSIIKHFDLKWARRLAIEPENEQLPEPH